MILRGNVVILGQRGEKIQKNDIIKTSKKSKLRIRFIDKTLISMGMNSEMVIDDYVYSGKKSKVNLDFEGALKAVTGKIGKLNPKKFNIKTKTATIGIRGTVFYMDTKEVGRYDLEDIRELGELIGLPKSEILRDYYKSQQKVTKKAKKKSPIQKKKVYRKNSGSTKINRTPQNMILGI